ncbi:hypothetical protein [Cohaesibacter intestini]|uniref:hypothetical protein n=1 Tax=Cohaesibacter intestini TaxID=2211145 RepID=UPI000DEA4D2C|nr:hypothetical protein [Cohaesibacter intestini]
MSDSPGLLKTKKKNGSVYYYWRATRAVSGNPRVKDYPDQSVNLTSVAADKRPELCQTFTVQLKDWLKNGRKNPKRYDGTIESLSRIYETHPNSPFQAVKYSTQHAYLIEAKVLITAVGKRRIDKVTGADVIRWHKKASEPASQRGPRRLRRAQGLVRHLRRIVSFGKMLRLHGCADFKAILSELRIEGPAPRKEAPEYHQVVAFIKEAHRHGRPSIALAQAIMFELTMRQSNVIGQWAPIGDEEGGIIAHGKRWEDGLVWQDIKNGVLTIDTSKTGATGKWIVDEYPLLVQELEKIPTEKRTGPIIIDENAGRPYFHRHFARKYREIAQAAGLPDKIWSRDYRAGGITEAMDADANIEHARQHATHSDIKMTGRYNRGSEKQTAKVARARAALRKREGLGKNKP